MQKKTRAESQGVFLLCLEVTGVLFFFLFYFFLYISLNHKGNFNTCSNVLGKKKKNINARTRSFDVAYARITLKMLDIAKYMEWCSMSRKALVSRLKTFF